MARDRKPNIDKTRQTASLPSSPASRPSTSAPRPSPSPSHQTPSHPTQASTPPKPSPQPAAPKSTTPEEIKQEPLTLGALTEIIKLQQIALADQEKYLASETALNKHEDSWQKLITLCKKHGLIPLSNNCKDLAMLDTDIKKFSSSNTKLYSDDTYNLHIYRTNFKTIIPEQRKVFAKDKESEAQRTAQTPIAPPASSSTSSSSSTPTPPTTTSPTQTTSSTPSSTERPHSPKESSIPQIPSPNDILQAQRKCLAKQKAILNSNDQKPTVQLPYTEFDDFIECCIRAQWLERASLEAKVKPAIAIRMAIATAKSDLPEPEFQTTDQKALFSLTTNLTEIFDNDVKIKNHQALELDDLPELEGTHPESTTTPTTPNDSPVTSSSPKPEAFSSLSTPAPSPSTSPSTPAPVELKYKSPKTITLESAVAQFLENLNPPLVLEEKITRAQFNQVLIFFNSLSQKLGAILDDKENHPSQKTIKEFFQICYNHGLLAPEAIARYLSNEILSLSRTNKIIFIPGSLFAYFADLTDRLQLSEEDRAEPPSTLPVKKELMKCLRTFTQQIRSGDTLVQVFNKLQEQLAPTLSKITSSSTEDDFQFFLQLCYDHELLNPFLIFDFDEKKKFSLPAPVSNPKCHPSLLTTSNKRSIDSLLLPFATDTLTLYLVKSHPQKPEEAKNLKENIQNTLKQFLIEYSQHYKIGRSSTESSTPGLTTGSADAKVNGTEESRYKTTDSRYLKLSNALIGYEHEISSAIDLFKKLKLSIPNSNKEKKTTQAQITIFLKKELENLQVFLHFLHKAGIFNLEDIKGITQAQTNNTNVDDIATIATQTIEKLLEHQNLKKGTDDAFEETTQDKITNILNSYVYITTSEQTLIKREIFELKKSFLKRSEKEVDRIQHYIKKLKSIILKEITAFCARNYVEGIDFVNDHLLKILADSKYSERSILSDIHQLNAFTARIRMECLIIGDISHRTPKYSDFQYPDFIEGIDAIQEISVELLKEHNESIDKKPRTATPPPSSMPPKTLDLTTTGPTIPSTPNTDTPPPQSSSSSSSSSVSPSGSAPQSAEPEPAPHKDESIDNKSRTVTPPTSPTPTPQTSPEADLKTTEPAIQQTSNTDTPSPQSSPSSSPSSATTSTSPMPPPETPATSGWNLDFLDDDENDEKNQSYPQLTALKKIAQTQLSIQPKDFQVIPPDSQQSEIRLFRLNIWRTKTVRFLTDCSAIKIDLFPLLSKTFTSNTAYYNYITETVGHDLHHKVQPAEIKIRALYLKPELPQYQSLLIQYIVECLNDLREGMRLGSIAPELSDTNGLRQLFNSTKTTTTSTPTATNRLALHETLELLFELYDSIPTTLITLETAFYQIHQKHLTEDRSALSTSSRPAQPLPEIEQLALPSPVAKLQSFEPTSRDAEEISSELVERITLNVSKRLLPHLKKIPPSNTSTDWLRQLANLLNELATPCGKVTISPAPEETKNYKKRTLEELLKVCRSAEIDLGITTESSEKEVRNQVNRTLSTYLNSQKSHVAKNNAIAIITLTHTYSLISWLPVTHFDLKFIQQSAIGLCNRITADKDNEFGPKTKITTYSQLITVLPILLDTTFSTKQLKMLLNKLTEISDMIREITRLMEQIPNSCTSYCQEHARAFMSLHGPKISEENDFLPPPLSSPSPTHHKTPEDKYETPVALTVPSASSFSATTPVTTQPANGYEDEKLKTIHDQTTPAKLVVNQSPDPAPPRASQTARGILINQDEKINDLYQQFCRHFLNKEQYISPLHRSPKPKNAALIATLEKAISLKDTSTSAQLYTVLVDYFRRLDYEQPPAESKSGKLSWFYTKVSEILSRTPNSNPAKIAIMTEHDPNKAPEEKDKVNDLYIQFCKYFQEKEKEEKEEKEKEKEKEKAKSSLDKQPKPKESTFSEKQPKPEESTSSSGKQPEPKKITSPLDKQPKPEDSILIATLKKAISLENTLISAQLYPLLHDYFDKASTPAQSSFSLSSLLSSIIPDSKSEKLSWFKKEVDKLLKEFPYSNRAKHRVLIEHNPYEDPSPLVSPTLSPTTDLRPTDSFETLLEDAERLENKMTKIPASPQGLTLAGKEYELIRTKKQNCAALDKHSLEFKVHVLQHSIEQEDLIVAGEIYDHLKHTTKAPQSHQLPLWETDILKFAKARPTNPAAKKIIEKSNHALSPQTLTAPHARIKLAQQSSSSKLLPSNQDPASTQTNGSPNRKG